MLWSHNPFKLFLEVDVEFSPILISTRVKPLRFRGRENIIWIKRGEE